MTAAKNNRIKATKPLKPFDGPGAVPQYASEQQLRDAQAREWVGQFVVFDYAEVERSVGLCAECTAIPRMEPDDIPDFRVVVQSLKTDKTAVTRLVSGRCKFYPTMEAAHGDALLRAGKEGSQ